jgi:peptidyl-prolyl cis-trans isomerase B (cyclophilin B)
MPPCAAAHWGAVATICRVTPPRRLSVLVVVPLLLLTSACGDDASETSPAEDSQCTYRESGQEAAKPVDPPPGNPAQDAPTEVVMTTNRGDIKISLDADKAPCAANSFLSLARQGFFDDTVCHRLTVGGAGALNVLQCGDPSATGSGDPGYEFDEELLDQDPRLQPCYGQASQQSGKEYCTYTAGTVAMAKGSQPGTTGSQFFLVFQDSILDAAYTVLGRMSAAGLKVVQSVAAQGVLPGTETPRQSVTISSVE